MKGILDGEPEVGFGTDALNPHATRPLELVGAKTLNDLRHEVMQACPRVPGVYGMLNPKGELIYVGKSKSLRNRLLSYFADSNADEKGGRIIENARAIQWETQPSDFAALVREQSLIRRFTPRWNVQGIPKRQRPVYLCLGRSPAAYFFLASKPPSGSIAAEGPFHGAGRMGLAVDALNNVFKLRDCSQQQVIQFAEQLSLFDLQHRPGCLRLEVGTCLGPCAAGCTREEYNERLAAAESYLDGFNAEPAELLTQQMRRAAANQQYELAARAQESLKTIEYVDRKLSMLARARRTYSFVYHVSGYDGCNTWYLIHGGEIVDATVAPKTAINFQSTKPLMERWSSILQSEVEKGHGPYAYTLPFIASWFRKNRPELKHTFAPEKAGHRYHRKSLGSV